MQPTPPLDMVDFLIMNDLGKQIPADARGEALAFLCFRCAHPVLSVASEGQDGSDEDHPATCKGCGIKYFLDVRPHMQKLYVHRL